MADFPNIPPSSRTFDMGDWPVKTFKAQNGAEIRVLYGSRRTNMVMNLEYRNINNTDAASLLQHYIDNTGTLNTFKLGPDEASGAKAGWNASDAIIGAGSAGNAWRYAEPPSVQTVKGGSNSYHTVSIKLIAVT